jgi:Spy/CpxP family protein refolding chaperone
LTDLQANLRDARWDFRAATLAENPNPDEIRASAQKMAGFQADTAIEMVAIKAEIKSLLTEEQRKVLDESKGRILERLRGFQEGLGRCLDSIEE